MRGTERAPSSSWKTLVNKNYLLILIAAAVVCAHPNSTFAMPSRSAISNAAEAGDDIRVKLDTVKSNVTVAGQNLSYPGSPITMAYGAVRIRWHAVGDGINEWQVEDRDTGRKLVSKYRAKSFAVIGRGLRINLKPLPGSLTLLAGKSGEASIVTAMDVETYVRGVLPAEMPQAWPIEALKAQAIAARTFALYKRKERRRINAAYDVESGVMDQVYMISVFEEGADSTLAVVEQAVRETKGVVLTTAARAPQLLAAYYHSDCGGRTEDARVIWSDKSSSGVATDSGCPVNPHAHWRLTLSLSEISQKIAASLGRRTQRDLVSIDASSYTASGRIAQLKLAWNDGSESTMPAHEFRMAVGHDQIKSTNFKVARAGGDIEFVGLGFGHGVGMCQWGARTMATSGRSYLAILGHYYPKAKLARLGTVSL